jgi:hypothetical protein
MEAYVHGVSTRSVDDLVAAMGVQAGVSKSEVSRICAGLDTEIEAFRTRSLTHTQSHGLNVAVERGSIRPAVSRTGLDAESPCAGSRLRRPGYGGPGSRRPRPYPRTPPYEGDSGCRRLTGPLSTRQGEIALARTLGSSALPDRLADEIREQCLHAGPGLFRVLPPPSCYAIPWELLPLKEDSEQRLIDLMDVVQIAPPLTRDGTAHKPQDSNTFGDNAFRVVDPMGPSPVMAPVFDLPDDQRHELYGWELDEFWQDWTPGVFIEELAERRPRTLLSVGHVGTAKDGTAALHLSAKTELSAAVLFGRGDVSPTSGALRGLPLPALVGLVACRSGADFGEIEPFGLVVAFLESGAERVTATRWTLPTDYAFSKVIFGEGPFDQSAFFKDGPFSAAAHAVGTIQQSSDPSELSATGSARGYGTGETTAGSSTPQSSGRCRSPPTTPPIAQWNPRTNPRDTASHRRRLRRERGDRRRVNGIHSVGTADLAVRTSRRVQPQSVER